MRDMNRRQFVKTSVAATVGIAAGLRHASGQAEPVGREDQVRVGFIGVGNRGSQLLQRFLAQKDCKVVALCDVYEPYLNRDPSQVGNWGVHYFDAIRWMLQEEAPAALSAHGGKFVIDDDRTIPDTMEVTFEFASGKLLVFGQYEGSGGPIVPAGEVELRGSLGNLYPASEAAGYRIVWAERGQFQPSGPKIKEEQHPAIDGDLTAQHARNFLDCVKSRKACSCDLETGHRSTTFAHLANIALATRSRLDWDAANERFINNEAANRLLSCEYREPWKLA